MHGLVFIDNKINIQFFAIFEIDKAENYWTLIELKGRN